MPTKRLCHRGDDANFRMAFAERPARRRFRSVLSGQGGEREFSLKSIDDLFSRNNVIPLPSAAGVERHELDHPHDDLFPNGKLREGLYLMIVQPTNHHSVYFHWSQIQRLG